MVCKKIVVYLFKIKVKQNFKSKPKKDNDTMTLKFLLHKTRRYG